MKNLISKHLKSYLVIGTVFCISLTVNAQEFYSGDRVGNGGDLCESLFQSTTNEIETWIKEGGHEGLDFPEDLTKDDYAEKMLSVIRNVKISCVDKELRIAGVEKTCKNFPAKNLVVCNKEKIESGKKNLHIVVHHELAGLAGFETNDEDENSTYKLSRQLRSLADNTMSMKLAVRPKYKHSGERYYCELVVNGPKFDELETPLPIKRRWEPDMAGLDSIVYVSFDFKETNAGWFNGQMDTEAKLKYKGITMEITLSEWRNIMMMSIYRYNIFGKRVSISDVAMQLPVKGGIINRNTFNAKGELLQINCNHN